MKESKEMEKRIKEERRALEARYLDDASFDGEQQQTTKTERKRDVICELRGTLSKKSSRVELLRSKNEKIKGEIGERERERGAEKNTSPDKQKLWAKRERTMSMTMVVGSWGGECASCKWSRLILLVRQKGHAQRVESCRVESNVFFSAENEWILGPLCCRVTNG